MKTKFAERAAVLYNELAAEASKPKPNLTLAITRCAKEHGLRRPDILRAYDAAQIAGVIEDDPWDQISKAIAKLNGNAS